MKIYCYLILMLITKRNNRKRSKILYFSVENLSGLKNNFRRNARKKKEVIIFENYIKNSRLFFITIGH